MTKWRAAEYVEDTCSFCNCSFKDHDERTYECPGQKCEAPTPGGPCVLARGHKVLDHMDVRARNWPGGSFPPASAGYFLPDEVHTFTSGAASSGRLPGLWLIPWDIFAERLASRYDQGTYEKYGEDNWRTGLKDREFVMDRASHMLKHAFKAVEELRLGKRDSDDNLSAVIWGAICLMAAQDKCGLGARDLSYKGERVQGKKEQTTQIPEPSRQLNLGTFDEYCLQYDEKICAGPKVESTGCCEVHSGLRDEHPPVGKLTTTINGWPSGWPPRAAVSHIPEGVQVAAVLDAAKLVQVGGGRPNRVLQMRLGIFPEHKDYKVWCDFMRTCDYAQVFPLEGTEP